jgi:hypothetical protein
MVPLPRPVVYLHKRTALSSGARNAGQLFSATAALAKEVAAKVVQFNIKDGMQFGQAEAHAYPTPWHRGIRCD